MAIRARCIVFTRALGDAGISPSLGQRLVEGPITSLNHASSSVNTWPAGVTTRN